MSGILHVIPTPLGNLEDITLRALRVLNEVDYIAAEDTRHTRRLLTHFDIHKPLMSYHQHTKMTGVDRILRALAEGDVGLVADAGMPGVADPGFELIRAALTAGYRVDVLPGPSAEVTAFVLAALPARGYVFMGFLPRQRQDARRVLADVVDLPYAIVLYEAPHRLIRTLSTLLDVLGDRQAVVTRELTKMHEESVRGSLSSVMAHFEASGPRGEFTIVVGSAQPKVKDVHEDEIRAALAHRTLEGMSSRDAIRAVCEALSVPRSAVYKVWLATKG